jgi:hypothetical protein
MLRRVVPALVLAVGLGSASCTLCKPIVGAITGPIVILGNSGVGNLNLGGGSNDGCALVAFFGVLAATGAIGGLVTGIISDVQALTGAAHDPCANWFDPFATNTSPRR